MVDGYIENFDLLTLLRYGDLDIRGIASHNRLLSEGEYFSRLIKFSDQAPSAAEALSWIVSNGLDRDALQSLASIKLSLMSIGCNKLVSAIDDIVEGGRQGDKTFAAARAKKILDQFNSVYSRIQSAKRILEQEPENASDASDKPAAYGSNPMSYESYPLRKVLQLIDHDEANRKLRVLAIDDAPVMLKIISSVLGDDYKVYTLTDPTMLEKFLQQVTPELFLLDYQMPGRNGFDLIPIIRSFEEHKTTPIIFLTSQGTIDHISAAVALGACDFMVKPFQADILREKIAKHIVRKRLI